MEPVILSEEQLRDLCKLWQERLRLQDWTINVTVVRNYEYVEGGTTTLGEIELSMRRKRATIRILAESDHAGALHDGEARDMEADLVHELLHIPFWHVTPQENSLQLDMLEQAIDTVSLALVQGCRRSECKVTETPTIEEEHS